MNVIGEKIIEVLKADSTLVALLGSAKNIFAMSLQEKPNRKTKYILVATTVGKETGDVPVQDGAVTIEGVVNREEAGGFGILAQIMDRVDTLLNKGEVTLSDVDWKIINFTRDSSEGIQIDSKTSEYYWDMEFSFLIDESINL